MLYFAIRKVNEVISKELWQILIPISCRGSIIHLSRHQKEILGTERTIINELSRPQIWSKPLQLSCPQLCVLPRTPILFKTYTRLQIELLYSCNHQRSDSYHYGKFSYELHKPAQTSHPRHYQLGITMLFSRWQTIYIFLHQTSNGSILFFSSLNILEWWSAPSITRENK